MRFGTTWSLRYEATASSRPFSVASPIPVTPEPVTIFSVTKLRAGQVTITSADTISRSRADPGFELIVSAVLTPIAPSTIKN